jgi:hypothetical protein
LHDLEAELAAFEQRTVRAVTAEQKQQISQISRAGKGFSGPTTTAHDSQTHPALIGGRHHGGAGTGAEDRQIAGSMAGGRDGNAGTSVASRTALPAFVAHIRELAVNHHDDQIVQFLRAEG